MFPNLRLDESGRVGLAYHSGQSNGPCHYLDRLLDQQVLHLLNENEGLKPSKSNVQKCKLAKCSML